jgi:alkanesulfonate monooxygenase SsuD/methylene tetrahydromethanopterin reductase-like flavin-dependent oxidoreductase (luciferase family)
MPEERPVHPWIAEGRTRVRFAVAAMFARTPEEIRAAAGRAERLGFDAYWANDHPNRSMDCWSTLTMLAASTQSLRLISLVSCVFYRSPFLLARQAADVDRLSGGRLVLGLGVGDDVPEFEQMRLEFPPLRARQEALEETIAIVRGLWSGEELTYEGRHLAVQRATMRGLPVQQPFVPLLIGGGGERVTLRQVARLADVSNFAPHEWSGSAFELADVVRKYAALRRFCEEAGRPFDSVLRTHYTPLLTLAADEAALAAKRASARIPDASLRQEVVFATPEQAIAHYQALAGAGVQYFLASIAVDDVETVEIFAEAVVPHVTLGATPGERAPDGHRVAMAGFDTLPGAG